MIFFSLSLSGRSSSSCACLYAATKLLSFQQKGNGPGGGVRPYMSYIGMCGPKAYGFSAVLVINRVSIFADFGYFGHI